MSIAGNIAQTEECILNACQRSGRRREEICLMGVTKFHPLQAVTEAWNAGLRCFGESRVQEAAEKFSGKRAGYEGMELHLIGSLQRNKVKAAVSLFDCIQSVDRKSLIPELAKQTAGREFPLPVLLEYRTGEDSKSGFTGTDDLFKAADLLCSCPSLRIRGLMTMAPNTSEEKPLRLAFRQLMKVREELIKRFPQAGSCISMGMSGDFEIAVEEGSTLLRIGSAIFGEKA